MSTPQPTNGHATDFEPDVTGMILFSCGALAVAVWHIAISNQRHGTKNSYAMLEEQCGVKTRQMQTVCGKLVAHGFFVVGDAGGGRGHERTFTPINPAINPANMGAINDTLYLNPAINPAIKGAVPPPHPLLVSTSLPSSETPILHLDEQKPKKPLPTNGPAQQIVAAYCAAAGIDEPASYKTAVGIAANIAKSGVTPDDIPSLYAASCWGDGTADLGKMLKSVDRWKQAKNGKTNGHANGHPDPGEDAFVEKWMAKVRRQSIAALGEDDGERNFRNLQEQGLEARAARADYRDQQQQQARWRR